MFVFELMLHVFVIAENAVAVGRLVEVLDDAHIKVIDVEATPVI